VKRPILRWKAIASILFFSYFVTTISLPAAAQLAASPTGINFGTVQVGTRASLSGVLTNADTDCHGGSFREYRYHRQNPDVP